MVSGVSKGLVLSTQGKLSYRIEDNIAQPRSVSLTLRRSAAHSTTDVAPCSLSCWLARPTLQDALHRPLEGAAVRFFGVDSLPTLTRAADARAAIGDEGEVSDGTEQEKRACKRQRCSEGSATASKEGDDRFWGRQHCEQCARGCIMALVEGATGAACPVEARAALAARRREAPLASPALIVFNLFALEGWHIAESLGIASVACSPCIIPYSAPSGFRSHFKQQHPKLYNMLEQNQDPNLVGWSEVEHWMWPLFAPRWASWRAECLGLPEVPLVVSEDQTPRLCPCTPLLYGLSTHVIPVPGYWPRSVEVCGNWFGDEPSDLPGTADGTTSQEARLELPAAIRGFIAGKARTVVISLGMASCSGVLENPEGLVDNLAAGLAACGADYRALLLLPNRSAPLTKAWVELCGGASSESKCEVFDVCEESTNSRSYGSWTDKAEASYMHPKVAMLGLIGSVPLAQLLPQCAVCFHHGGSGTTAASLRAGLPQIICPFAFDQFYWAERMAWMGVAPAALSAALLSGQPSCTLTNQLAACIKEACAGEMSVRAKSVASLIAKEQGIRNALSVIQEVLSVQTRQCNVSLHSPTVPNNNDQQDGEVSSLSNPSTTGLPATTSEFRFPCGLVLDILPGTEVEVNHIYTEVFVNDVYFQHGVHLVPGGVVVDVGANIGMFVRRVLQECAVKTPQRIIAVEPIPTTHAVLRKNTCVGRADSMVETVQSGLYSRDVLTNIQYTSRDSNCHEHTETKEKLANFTYYPRMPGNSTLFPDEKFTLQALVMNPSFFEGALVKTCPVMTLSQLMSRCKIACIDLLKLDVEGAELEVLRGIDQHDWMKIKQIVCEVHDVDGRLAEVVSLLYENSYRLAVEELENCPKGSFMVWASKLLGNQ